MTIAEDEEFWKPRRCLCEPIPDIFHAAFLLDRAVGAHLAGDRPSAETLIQEASMPSVRAWTESLWGSKGANPDQWRYLRFRVDSDAHHDCLRKNRRPKGIRLRKKDGT